MLVVAINVKNIYVCVGLELVPTAVIDTAAGTLE